MILIYNIVNSCNKILDLNDLKELISLKIYVGLSQKIMS